MKKLLLLCSVFFSLAISVKAQDIYTYDNDVAGAPIFVDPNISASSNLTAIGTGTNTPCNFGFSGITGFNVTGYSTGNPCVEVSITAAAGYTLDVTGFNAGIRASNTGPTLARFAYSIDGGTNWIDEGFDEVPFSGGCYNGSNGNINNVTWTTTVSSPALLFRIYPHDASGANGTFQVYGLHIIGTVVPACTTPVITPFITNPTCNGFGDGALNLGLAGGSSPFTFSWAGPNGFSNDSQNISGLIAGTYTLTITATGGCSATSTYVINPTPPVATPNIAGATTLCAGTTLSLTAMSSTPGSSYSWTGPNGNSSSFQTLIVNNVATADAGTYSVVATSNGCLSGTATTLVTVNPLPNANISALGATTFCQGDSVSLAAAATPGNTYQWQNSTGNIPGATNNTYTATMQDSYTLTVANSFGCTKTSFPILVTVNPLPVSVASPEGATTACTGSTIILDALTAPGETYQWQRDGVSIPGATDATYTVTTTGEYTVVTSNGSGCSSVSLPVEGVVLDSAYITALNPTSFCWGSTSQLLAATGNTGSIAVTYQWLRDGVIIPSANDSTYMAYEPGQYTCSINYAGTCTSSTTPLQLTQFQLPNPIVTDDNGVLQVDGFATYQWYYGNQPVAGATGPVYAPHGTGDYYVSVTDGNGCTGVSEPFVVSTLGISTTAGTSADITIYPNPATDKINIISPVKVHAIIRSADGRTVADEYNATAIDVTGLASGLYILELRDSSNNVVKINKLVKR